MGSSTGPSPASRWGRNIPGSPEASHQLVKCYYLVGAFPQNMFFGADSQHQPGAGARGMWPNMFVPWPKLPGGLAAAWSWGRWGLRFPGDPAGWRGTRAGDRKSVCHGGVSAALGAGGDSPLTSTLIFITQLHYGADMKCGAGERGEINTAPARGAAASPVKSDGFPRPPPRRCCFLRLVDFDGGK